MQISILIFIYRPFDSDKHIVYSLITVIFINKCIVCRLLHHETVSMIHGGPESGISQKPFSVVLLQV